MAPIFSKNIGIDDKVHLVYRNRKGEILFEGYGIVDFNKRTSLIILVDKGNGFGLHEDVIWVNARDVYYGKHSLKLIED